MDRTLHKQNFFVTIAHCDPDSKAALRFFADCFQDAAGKHAASLDLGIEDLGKQSRFWALTRILCEIERRPAIGEEVIVETWPKGSQGLFALRDFTMHTRKGEVLARATSSWVVVDGKSRRILHPPTDRKELYARKDINSIARQPPKIDEPEGEFESQTRKLFFSDTDLIHHVNNARYLDFMVDLHDYDFLLMYPPRAYAINFLTECHAGDTLELQLHRQDGRSTVISKKADGKKAFTGRIWWKMTTEEEE